MTPRERAEALTDDDIEMLLDDIYDTNIDGRPEVVRLYVSKWLAEHVRALLADDEATIEAIATAIYQQPWRTVFAELPGNAREYWRRYALAALAALRRKALEQ